jgi:hypothetical protein
MIVRMCAAPHACSCGVGVLKSGDFISGRGECLSEARCAEHFDDALEVVSHDGDDDFSLSTCQARNSKCGCPKIRYLIVPKGCSTVVRRSRIVAGVARAFIRLKASSSMERETTRHADLVQRLRLGQALQSLMAAS